MTDLTPITSRLDKIEANQTLMYGILKEIYAALTEESSGDLVAALRELTSAINDNPNAVVEKLRPIVLALNGR